MFFRWPLYQRVLVNLVDGTAIQGLLTDKRGALLVLADATLLAPDQQPTAMDGDVYVERAKVLFLQHVKGG